MSKKYIKVTEKDKSSVIVLASNEGFYKSRGAKIEEPTKKEIEKFFLEELKKESLDENGKFIDAKKAELENVKSNKL
jgi:DNA helicase TIP49 (TBP-interacting protein)